MIIITWWHCCLLCLPTTKKTKKMFFRWVDTKVLPCGLNGRRKGPKNKWRPNVPGSTCSLLILDQKKEKGAFYESLAEMALLHKDSFINVEFLGLGFFSFSNILIFLAPCNAYLYYHPKERILNFSSRIMLCTRKKAGSHGYGHNNILDVNKNAFHKYLWIEVVYVFREDGEIGDDNTHSS